MSSRPSLREDGPAALEWALETLDPEWRPLLRQVMDDRPLPWNDPPRPGSVERTHAFAAYALDRHGLVARALDQDGAEHDPAADQRRD